MSYKNDTLTKIDKDFEFPSTPCALHYDENTKTLYAGTYWNGVYKFNKEHWESMSNGLPENAGVIKVLADSHGVLFALLKDQSRCYGIYKYDKVENKWAPFNSGLTRGMIENTVNFASNAKSELFLQISGRGIYKTKSQNDNWKNIVSNSGFKPQNIAKVIILNNGIIIALSGSSKGGIPFGYSTIYSSEDEGKTWKEISNTINLELEGNNKYNYLSIMDIYSQKNTIYAITYHGRLFIKTGDKSQWSIAYESFPSSPNSIVVDKNSIIYVSTFWNGVYKSNDNGRTFESTGSPNKGGYHASLYFESNYLYLKSDDGKLYRTSDQANSWEEVEE